MRHDFDRNFHREQRGIMSFGLPAILLTVAFYGALILGIIELLLWLTGSSA